MGPVVAIVQIPLTLVAIVAGLLAIGLGLQRKNAVAITTGCLGLLLIGSGAWFAIDAVLHF